jgi:hypothetical protein
MSRLLADRIREHRKTALSSSQLLEQALGHLSVAHPVPSTRANETIALILVIHRETDRGIKGSVDGKEIHGEAGLEQWFPKSLVDVRKRLGEFALVTMKGRVAIQRHTAQASLPRLSDSVIWSVDQRTRWAEMKRELSRLRQALEDERRASCGKRRIYRGGGNAYGRNYFS